MQVTLARESPQGFTRAEWLLYCEASYPKVFRALVAMGANLEDASDALQDAFEDALGEPRTLAKPEGGFSSSPAERGNAIVGGIGSFAPSRRFAAPRRS